MPEPSLPPQPQLPPSSVRPGWKLELGVVLLMLAALGVVQAWPSASSPRGAEKRSASPSAPASTPAPLKRP